MNYKKVLPAVALTLGMSAQIAAQAELFQMSEVSGHGLLIACDAEHKCAAGACGSDKKGEHQAADKKVAADEHKCATGACGSDKKDDHHCGADYHNKDDAHKCAADKKDDHHCGADKHEKGDDHKCAAGACGASH
jgi:uncharacterized low-complexity protein